MPRLRLDRSFQRWPSFRKEISIHPSNPHFGATQQKGSEPFLLDHLIGGGKELRMKLQAKRLGGVEVDHKLKFAGLHDGKIAGFLTLQDTARVEPA
jgi:hypothetical protein